MANEVELNPVLVQGELCRFMKAQEIVPIAYCPVSRLGEQTNEHLESENFVAICQKYSKTQAQVMLNWAVARGTIPIPRSGSIGHIVENIDIYDFKLTDEEMEQVNQLDKNFRICDSFFGAVSFFC